MIVVVGSLNMDLVVSVPRFPAPGETLIGGDYAQHPGGKGANQAVAAARAGGQVVMVGRLGNDGFAAVLRGQLEQDSIDTSYIANLPDAPTGWRLSAWTKPPKTSSSSRLGRTLA